MKRSNQGAVLSTVLISLVLVGIIAGSVASLVNFQRKMGISQQLKLHSMAAAEAAIDYAYSYVTNDANANGIDASNYIPPAGGTPFAFTFTADALNFLRNKNGLPSSAHGADAIDFSNIRVSVMPRSGVQVRIYKDPKTTPVTDPNRGQWVYEETLTMVAAVTATQAGITQTSYARKDINYNITNLFQHAIFYQGQLHLHRGFKVMGSVHTNGNLILNAHNGDNAIYNGFVAAGNRFYRGSIIDCGGTGANAFALVPQLPNGDLDPTKFTTVATGNGSGNTYTPSSGDIPIYIDTPTPGNFLYRFVDQTTDSRMTPSPNAWLNATTNYNGYLQDISNSVPIINPIGSIGYNMDASNPVSNGPYFLIEPLLPATHPLRTAANTQKSNYRYNLSANAALVLRVEYIARTNTGALVSDPNSDKTYLPDSSYTAATALYQSQNPANYIVRAYKKPATMARANDPSDRIPIPFPTDVIGRADYHRVENQLVNGNSYVYAAGVAPQAIDVLGTESNITVASPATAYSPARVTSGDAVWSGTNSAQVAAEAWHRYHIECYYPYYNSGGTPPTYSTTQPNILTGIGTPKNPRTTPPTLTPATAVAGQVFPQYGLHDSRLGRGAHLLTLDISRLKQIMEEPIANVKAKYGAEAEAFRYAFNYGAQEWNGIIYVEFPTSTKVLYTNSETSPLLNHAPPTSVYKDTATHPETPNDTSTPGHSYLDTFLFDYAPVAYYTYSPNGSETRYPLRVANTSTVVRTDAIVPIAPDFRTYPSTVDSHTIADPANAILALQVINAKQLPKVSIVKFDATSSNTLSSGFTLATNAPVYLIGSWNSDGDYTTGTNVTSTDPTKYATTDTLTSTSPSNPEIPSAIFCDTFTVMTPGWATQTNYPNLPAAQANATRRQNSYPGWGGNSYTYRTATWLNANERIEVSACIATGEFPIFEFFPHALEDFNLTNGTPCTPLVVKGAMVGMFTSEIQHIKQAYGRDPTRDIQVYWTGHGAYCFPSPRLHQFILDGNFPPGTPQALVPSQSNFQVIFKSDPLVGACGF